jgi:pyocin large subunit-like protein
LLAFSAKSLAPLHSSLLALRCSILCINQQKKDAERHFLKHGHEFGFKTPKEYYHSAYEVIKKPDEVYIERVKDKTFYIFRKDDKVVISSDDGLAIKTFLS